MPDIAMCKNNVCPSREKCYRHTAKPGRLQSYAGFSPDEGEQKCQYFMDAERIIARRKI